MAKYTNKRKKELLGNKYVLTIAKNHIIYTEEFRKKVVIETNDGKSIIQVFKECGFNPHEIGIASLRANKSKWKNEFKIIKDNGIKKAVRIKGSCPTLDAENNIKYIPVINGSLIDDYSPEEIKELQKSKFVEYVDKCKIKFTREFKILFISELEKGKGNQKIFLEYGLNPLTVRKNRIKSFARTWKKQAKKNPNFTEKVNRSPKKIKVVKSKEKSNDIKFLQKRIKQLEMENAFLKKVQALRKG